MNIERVKLKDGSVYPVSPAWFEGTEYNAQMSNIDYKGAVGTYKEELTKSDGTTETMEMPLFKFTDHVMTKEELSSITVSDVDCVAKINEALKDDPTVPPEFHDSGIYDEMLAMVEILNYGSRLPRASDVETRTLELEDPIFLDQAVFGTEDLSCIIISIPDDVAAKSPIVANKGSSKVTVTIPGAGTYAASDLLMQLSALSAQLRIDYPAIMYDMKFIVSNGKFHFDNRYVGSSAIVDVYMSMDGDNDNVICQILDREGVATIDNVPTTNTLLSATIPFSGKEYLKQALMASRTKYQYIHLIYGSGYDALIDPRGIGQMIAVSGPVSDTDLSTRNYLGIQKMEFNPNYSASIGRMNLRAKGSIMPSNISIVDAEKLEAARPTENDIVLVYDGNSWKSAADFTGAAVDIISVYGLDCTVMPSYGDKLIVCVYNPEISTTGTLQAADVTIDKSIYKTKAGNFSKEFEYDGTKWTLLGETNEEDLSTYGITISESATPASGDKIKVAVPAYDVEQARASSLTWEAVSVNSETFRAYTNELRGSIVFIYYDDGWHKTDASGVENSDIDASTDQGLVDLNSYGITIKEGHTPAYKDAMLIEGKGNCITLSVKKLV